MSVIDQTPPLVRVGDVTGLVASGLLSVGAVGLAVEQAALSPPVWSSLEVAVVSALGLLALLFAAVAVAFAARLDNRGGGR